MTSPPQTPSSDRAGSPGTASGASRRSGGNGGDTRQAAHELGDKARQEGKARLDDARTTAAHNVDKLASSAQAAAARLAQDDIGHMSHYLSDLADGMTRLSGSLREKSGDELLHEVARIAREKPAMFVAGSVAIGLGLGRFARASSPSARGVDRHSALTTADDTWQGSGSATTANGSATITGGSGS